MYALVREFSAASNGGEREAAAALRELAVAAAPDTLLLLVEDGGGGLAVLLADELPAVVPPPVERYEVRLMAGKFAGTAARVFSVSLRPGAHQSMVSAFQNLTMRAATGQQGFRGGLLLVDPERDHVLSIGIWEDMARLEASAASGYLADQISAYLPYLQQTPTERRMRILHP